MADDNKSDKRSNSSGNNPSGNSWLMLTLLAILLIMAAISFVSSALYQEIRYPDLIQLIDATKYSDETQSSLSDENAGKKTISIDGEQYELSRIRNVQVDKETVRGEVTVAKIVDGKPTQPRARIFQSIKDNSESTNKELKEKLTASKISWGNSPGQSMLTQFFWMFFLPFFLISTLLYFFMRRMGGIGSPMQFGRSRGKLYAQEDIGVMFHDVAGIDEAVEEVREIVDFLKHPEKYQRLGGPDSPRCVARRSSRNRQDVAGESHRRRGGSSILLIVRFGLCRNVCRGRSRSRARYVPTSRGKVSLHYLHR